MPGPPPIPFKLRVLRGNPSKRRLLPEIEPSSSPQCPERPAFVTGYAADEWDRVAPELHRLGLLTMIDTTTLAAYCVTYARWRIAEETLAQGGGALLIETDKGDLRTNPLVRISRDAAADMVRYSGLFGLTPVARSRLAAGIGGQPKGKFDGFVA